MRVELRRRRDQRGAIAIMVAMMMVLLCVFGALVVDFGQAYVNKRQAQTAADAGALAAAKVYADAKATCDQIPAHETVAEAAANAMRLANQPDSTSGTLTVTCDNGVIKTDYDVQTNSPLGLGQLATGKDHLTVERNAAAEFGVSQEAVGALRPWMICGAMVPDGPYPSNVVEVGLPGNGHTAPPSAGCSVDKSGDWWKTACEGEKNASHNDTINAIEQGCDQVTLAPSTPGAPADVLSQELRTDCKNGALTTYCLADDTGRDVKNGVFDAWMTQLGKTIAMPVFCDATPAGNPDCDPSSVPSDTKSTWPVWKIAAVTVCGFALHGQYSDDGTGVLPTGDCNNLNPKNYLPGDFDSSGIGFLLIFRGILESGGQTTFPTQTSTTLRLVE